MHNRLCLHGLREGDRVLPHEGHARWPLPGSPEELVEFSELQRRLARMFRDVFPDPRAPRTIVVVPSLSGDAAIHKIEGVSHYEERLLCLLLLLRLPRAQVIYVTSAPIAPATIDYYLHLLPGIPASHARSRLHLLSCYDTSVEPLTKKVLDRPRLIERIIETIDDTDVAHMTCFAATAYERSLAVRLGIPLYACDPLFGHLGTKSGSREVFREAGIRFPDGTENVRDETDAVDALYELKQRYPDIRAGVIKLDHGASGLGNATFSFANAPVGRQLKQWIQASISRRVVFEAEDESWDSYCAELGRLGGVVEVHIDGNPKRSPSVQGRITPAGRVEMVSTHDQVLGGATGQTYLGCSFPADAAYRLEIQEIGAEVGRVLCNHGALGRFGVDFVSTRDESGKWNHYAVEINLRKGGTTHPFLVLDFLMDGHYDVRTGCYHTVSGRPCYYIATDNLRGNRFRGLTPEDLMDIAVDHNLHYNSAMQRGVFFHLIGALSEFGKLGVLSVAGSARQAHELFGETVTTLKREVRRGRRGSPSHVFAPAPAYAYV